MIPKILADIFLLDPNTSWSDFGKLLFVAALGTVALWGFLFIALSI